MAATANAYILMIKYTMIKFVMVCLTVQIRKMRRIVITVISVVLSVMAIILNAFYSTKSVMASQTAQKGQMRKYVINVRNISLNVLIPPYAYGTMLYAMARWIVLTEMMNGIVKLVRMRINGNVPETTQNAFTRTMYVIRI